MPTYDRISLNMPDACERYATTWLLMRWRIYVDMTPHFNGRRLIVRFPEAERWHRRALKLGLAGVEQHRWPIHSIMDDVMDEPVVFSFISCTPKRAAERTGISESLIYDAVREGRLTSHRPGPGRRRIVIRAQDLDDWVKSLPTESSLERWRGY